MSYDWNKPEDKFPERLPEGSHLVKIGRLIHGSKSRGTFRTKNGDPQMMVVFAPLDEDDERQATTMVTLSRKAGWVLKRLLTACEPAFNFEKMNAAGVEPASFADNEFATLQLPERRLWIRVEDVPPPPDQPDARTFQNVEPIPPDKLTGAQLQQLKSGQPTAAATAPAAAAADWADDDIPF